MNRLSDILRRQLEQSGEILREKENVQGQSDTSSQNQWEETMKDMPSYEEHMEQMESKEEEMSM